jgi:hypothetical protein
MGSVSDWDLLVKGFFFFPFSFFLVYCTRVDDMGVFFLFLFLSFYCTAAGYGGCFGIGIANWDDGKL